MALLDEYRVGEDGAWSDREAAHLLRRAGFGGSIPEREAAVGNGSQEAFRAAIAGLVDYLPDDPNLDAPSGVGVWGGPFAALPDGDTDEGNTKNPTEIMWLSSHLFYRLRFTSQPLQEQFGQFLHDHFVSEFWKVYQGVERFQGGCVDVRAKTAELLLQQNTLLRRIGIDDFRETLIQISRDPAMLFYLDNVVNGAGAGRAQENYAREIMELFSMGVDNYSENDVREIAKCFTGETLPNIRDCDGGFGAPDAFEYGFRDGNHEPGEKVVFGQIVTEDMTGGELPQVVDLILSKVSVQPSVQGLPAPYNNLPAAAVYMSWKLLRWFVNQNVALDPPADAVLELADYMRGTDTGDFPQRRYPYDLRACMYKLLSSRYFFGEANYFSIVKTPADFAAMLVRILDIDYYRGIYGDGPANRMEWMGMRLFDAPDVSGWRQGRRWINAEYLAERINFVERITSWYVSDEWIDDLQVLNGGSLQPADHAGILDYFIDLLVQDDLEVWAPGSRTLLLGYMAEVADRFDDTDRRFQVQVRGIMYFLMSLPVWQMK
ncbi:MAG: DUF1800 family protein [Candidatus Hydrogenedentes bacterium]|nr:DUF1800 family protein [Candidatus Hydrogenedentota bacterium]